MREFLFFRKENVVAINRVRFTLNEFLLVEPKFRNYLLTHDPVLENIQYVNGLWFVNNQRVLSAWEEGEYFIDHLPTYLVSLKRKIRQRKELDILRKSVTIKRTNMLERRDIHIPNIRRLKPYNVTTN